MHGYEREWLMCKQLFAPKGEFSWSNVSQGNSRHKVSRCGLRLVTYYRGRPQDVWKSCCSPRCMALVADPEGSPRFPLKHPLDIANLLAETTSTHSVKVCDNYACEHFPRKPPLWNPGSCSEQFTPHSKLLAFGSSPPPYFPPFAYTYTSVNVFMCR